MTKNLDLYSGKRKKDEILHFVQNDRVESERITAKFQFSTTGALNSNCSFLIVYCPYVLSKQLTFHNKHKKTDGCLLAAARFFVFQL